MRWFVRHAWVGLVSVGSILACADTSAPPEPERPLVAKPPAWLRLGWDTTLMIAPDPHAAGVRLLAAEPGDPSSGRVVRVVGSAGPTAEWWQVETVTQAQAGALGLAIEGLDVYALTLYVPVGTGTPLDGPAPIDTVESASADVLVQTGEARGRDLAVEWRIAAEAGVYWPDGSPAGRVRRAHAFLQAGGPASGGVTVDGQPLRCFDARVGPPLGPSTRVCFEPAAVTEGLPAGTDDSSLEGLADGYGDALPTGMGMTGTGMQNGGNLYPSGLADIPAGGLGYGSDGDTFPDLKIGTIQVDGPERELVRKIVRKHVSELRRCYYDLAARDPTAAGSLTLTLQIADAGTMTAKVRSFDAALSECVRERAEQWTGPSGEAGSATVPIELRLEGQAPGSPESP